MKHLCTLLLLIGGACLFGQEYFKQGLGDGVGHGFPKLLTGDAVAVQGVIKVGNNQTDYPFSGMLDREGNLIGSLKITDREQPAYENFVRARQGGGYHWVIKERGLDDHPSAFSLTSFGAAGQELNRSAYVSEGAFFDAFNLVVRDNGKLDATGYYGRLENGEQYGLVLRLDSSGDVESAFGFDPGIGDQFSIYNGASTSDGGVVYTAVARRDLGDLKDQFYVFKISDTGELVWSWRRPVLSSLTGVWGIRAEIEIDADGNIWMLTPMENSFSETAYGVVKLNEAGEIQLAMAYSLPGFNHYSTVDLLPGENGGIKLLMVGYEEETFESVPVVLRLDANGIVERASRIEENNNYYGRIEKMSESPGYFLSGTSLSCDTVGAVNIFSFMDENFSFGSNSCFEQRSVATEHRDYDLDPVSAGALIPLSFEKIAVGGFTDYEITAYDLTCPALSLTGIDSLELACVVETLAVPFLTDASISRNGRGLQSVILTIADPDDNGTIFLPADFPVTTEGNGTRELTIITDYEVSEADLRNILRAVEYRAPDWPTMDGEHTISIIYSWTCGTEELPNQQFTIISPPIFPGVGSGGDSTICFPDTLLLMVASPLGTEFNWSTGDTSRVIEVADPGVYSVTVSNFCGADSAFFTLTANEDPPLADDFFTFDLCPGDSVAFALPPALNTTGVWADGPVGVNRVFNAPGNYVLQRNNSCSAATTLVTITGLPEAPVFGGPETVNYCAEETVRLSPPPVTGATYRWSTGETSPQIIAPADGEYSVTATNICGTDTLNFYVSQFEGPPLDDLRRDFRLCFNDSLRFRPADDGADSYLWEDGSTNPWRTFRTAGEYRVTRSNQCYSADTRVIVGVVNCCEVYLPTAFSPNGDGINDRFGAFLNEAYCPAEPVSLRVYDRWGGVHYSGTQTSGWDGKDAAGLTAQPGVYAYVFRYSNGERVVEKKGLVTLMR